jgi:bifunctional DNA-binding transcriptional regulator/antitoxin component of YhaV-PrlF toxin-antitoxin module
MSLQSTVGIARTGAKSLRATVPEGIVAFLELSEGDKLEWRMDVRDGERLVIVRKARTANADNSRPRRSRGK